MSIVLSYSIASATIINVPADSSTIQGGINGSSDGDTVLVQPGTYVENIIFGDHNIVLGSLFLTTGDTSYISQTIIDGDSAGSVVTFGSGVDSTTIITGFNIQNGLGGGVYATYYGGGITCRNSNPIIQHNTIVNNYSDKHGGGILCKLYANPLILNNKIILNYAVMDAGGIMCFDSCNAIIENNSIIGNISNAGAGGIYCWKNDSYIANNIIAGNTATDEAGGVIISEGNQYFGYNIVSGNSCTGIGGGGILCANGFGNISNNIIFGNSADAWCGGGICCFNATPQISNNSIFGNFALLHGGGIYIEHETTPIIENTIIWGNNAGAGNEVFVQSGTPIFAYCDIQDTLWPGRATSAAIRSSVSQIPIISN